MNYVGIDLHSNNSVIAMVDERGRRHLDKRLPNELPVILSQLEGLGPIASVAVESTYNHYWLTDGLLDAGYKVLLANPLAMQPYRGLKHQDDHYDAGWIAELQRLGILPTAHLYSRQRRGLRDVLRQRSRFVQLKTSLLLSLQSRYARWLGQRVCKSQLLAGDVPDLGDEHENLAAHSQLDVLSHLTEQIQWLEDRVSQQLHLEDPSYRRLVHIQGIGPVLASTIVLETGDLSRFPRVGKYASYARVVNSTRWTNFKKKGDGNRRCGNRYLGWAFHEAAHCMHRSCTRMQKFRKHQLSRGKHPRVVWSTMANKVCRGLYLVMRDADEFSPERLFG
ncbi:MAG: IS110 family transposase [Anaerolineae bacterium]|nr:IS110 family transposase [Anaerolineae bacterium]